MSYYGTPGMPLVPAGGTSGPPPVPFEEPRQLFRYGEQSLWSSQFFAGGAGVADSVNRLFTTPLGQVGGGFTRAMTIGETNLKEGGRIPNGVAYDVFGISAHVIACTAATDAAGTDFDQTINSDGLIQNLVNILNNGVLTWDFTQTQVDVAPFSLIGSGGGVFGPLGIVANNAQSTGHVGNGAGSIWMYRKHPVALPGATTFSLLLRFGNRASAMESNNGMVVKVSLMGYYKNIIEIG